MAPSAIRAGPSTFARLAPGCRRRSTSRQPFPSRNGEPSAPTAVEGDEDVLEHHLEEIYDENQDDRRYVDAAEIGHEATDRPERRIRHPPEELADPRDPRVAGVAHADMHQHGPARRRDDRPKLHVSPETRREGKEC